MMIKIAFVAGIAKLLVCMPLSDLQGSIGKWILLWSCSSWAIRSIAEHKIWLCNTNVQWEWGFFKNIWQNNSVWKRTSVSLIKRILSCTHISRALCFGKRRCCVGQPTAVPSIHSSFRKPPEKATSCFIRLLIWQTVNICFQYFVS